MINQSDLKVLLQKLGCFAFDDTKEGFKCQFDSDKARFHLYYDERWSAEYGPFTLYAGGMDLTDVESSLNRLINK